MKLKRYTWSAHIWPADGVDYTVQYGKVDAVCYQRALELARDAAQTKWHDCRVENLSLRKPFKQPHQAWLQARRAGKWAIYLAAYAATVIAFLAATWVSLAISRN